MSPDRQLSGLLHPDQVLTVSQAAAWVESLIDHFTEHVTTLPVCTLECCEDPGFFAVHERLLEHAGVLEQLLCRICFLLPGHVVERVVAIIVAAHHQRSLLEAEDTYSVLDPQIIAWMSSYLSRVLSYLYATHAWVYSNEYVRVWRGVDCSIAEMRRSLAPFIERCTGGEEGYASGPAGLPFPNVLEPTGAPDALTSFLSSLHPDGSRAAPSLPEADRVVLTRNFRPLVRSEILAYTDPDVYTCRSSPPLSSASSEATGSPTAYSVSLRTSQKGKQRALPTYTRSPSPGASDESTSAETGFPGRLPPMPPPTASSQPVDSQGAGLSTRKRTRAVSASRRTKRRVSLGVYGICGDPPDSDVHNALVERVKPFIGRTVPLGISAFDLPSRHSSPSPAPSTSSMSCQASPVLPLAPLPASVESTPSPPGISSSVDISALRGDDASCYSSSESSDTSTYGDDMETTSDASSYVTAWDVTQAEGPSGHPDITQHEHYTARTGEAPERTRTTRRKRRCFAGLLQTVKHIFTARR